MSGQTAPVNNFGKYFLTVILGIIGLFSFFVPIVLSFLFLFRVIDTSDWSKDSSVFALVLVAYVIFWFATLVCLGVISDLFKLSKKEKWPEQDTE